MLQKVSANNFAYFILLGVSLIVFIASLIMTISVTSGPKAAYMIVAMLFAGTSVFGGTPRAYNLLTGVQTNLKEQQMQKSIEVVMTISTVIAFSLFAIGWFLIR